MISCFRIPQLRIPSMLFPRRGRGGALVFDSAVTCFVTKTVSSIQQEPQFALESRVATIGKMRVLSRMR